MSGLEEEKKPADQAAHINLKVKGQAGNEVLFRIKHSTQLRKHMNAYCHHRSVDINSMAFLFDGRRLQGDPTPEEETKILRWKMVTRVMPCCTKLAADCRVHRNIFANVKRSSKVK